MDIDASQIVHSGTSIGRFSADFDSPVSWVLEDGLDLTILFTEGERFDVLGWGFTSVGGTYNAVGNLEPHPLNETASNDHDIRLRTRYLDQSFAPIPLAVRNDDFSLSAGGNEIVLQSSGSTLFNGDPLSFYGLRVTAEPVSEPGLSTTLSNVKISGTDGLTVVGPPGTPTVPEPGSALVWLLVLAGVVTSCRRRLGR